MLPTEEQQTAFERLQRNRDMQMVISFYEDKLKDLCDIRKITSPDAIEYTKMAAQYIQIEFLDRLKKYKTSETRNNDDIAYL